MIVNQISGHNFCHLSMLRSILILSPRAGPGVVKAAPPHRALGRQGASFFCPVEVYIYIYNNLSLLTNWVSGWVGLRSVFVWCGKQVSSSSEAPCCFFYFLFFPSFIRFSREIKKKNPIQLLITSVWSMFLRLCTLCFLLVLILPIFIFKFPNSYLLIGFVYTLKLSCSIP